MTESVKIIFSSQDTKSYASIWIHKVEAAKRLSAWLRDVTDYVAVVSGQDTILGSWRIGEPNSGCEAFLEDVLDVPKYDFAAMRREDEAGCLQADLFRDRMGVLEKVLAQAFDAATGDSNDPGLSH